MAVIQTDGQGKSQTPTTGVMKPAIAWLNIAVNVPTKDDKGKVTGVMPLTLGGKPITEDGFQRVRIGSKAQESNPEFFDWAVRSNALQQDIEKRISTMKPGETYTFKLSAELEIRIPGDKNQTEINNAEPVDY